MRILLTLLLSLAITVSGLPVQVQAAPSCPMMAKMKMEANSMQMGKDCKGCDMSSKQEQKKNTCCGDKSCVAQCSVVGSVGNVASTNISLFDFHSVAQKFAMADGTLPSYFLQTQERPPKHLS